jgi:hypothetical protein
VRTDVSKRDQRVERDGRRPTRLAAAQLSISEGALRSASRTSRPQLAPARLSSGGWVGTGENSDRRMNPFAEAGAKRRSWNSARRPAVVGWEPSQSFAPLSLVSDGASEMGPAGELAPTVRSETESRGTLSSATDARIAHEADGVDDAETAKYTITSGRPLLFFVAAPASTRRRHARAAAYRTTEPGPHTEERKAKGHNRQSRGARVRHLGDATPSSSVRPRARRSSRWSRRRWLAAGLAERGGEVLREVGQSARPPKAASGFCRTAGPQDGR